MMERHDQLSDKALSRLLVAGGLVRVAALAGIVLMQVAYPGMSLRLPLSYQCRKVLTGGRAWKTSLSQLCQSSAIGQNFLALV